MYPAPHKICNLQYFIYEHNKGYDGLLISSSNLFLAVNLIELS